PLYHCWWARRKLLCSPYEFSDILRKIILLKRYIALEQRALSFTQNCWIELDPADKPRDVGI
ncbi:MAG: hypothetical protein Q8R24_02185, partial [Legionellaceae bacterium]|nr:hypothetical protein [Legionellaceae bacterium]